MKRHIYKTDDLLQLESGEEIESPRIIRTPLRLRFGRRSDEQAVPHVFPQEVNIQRYNISSTEFYISVEPSTNMFLY